MSTSQTKQTKQTKRVLTKQEKSKIKLYRTLLAFGPFLSVAEEEKIRRELEALEAGIPLEKKQKIKKIRSEKDLAEMKRIEDILDSTLGYRCCPKTNKQQIKIQQQYQKLSPCQKS